MRYFLALWSGKLTLWLLRRSGRSGSALPGLVALKLEPDFLTHAAKRLSGSVVITGTNGKTTTAKALEQLLRRAGWSVMRNRAGSNMSRGIAAAVVENSLLRGSLKAEWAVLEVDEAFAALVAASMKPQAIVVLNLLRDQLDRYGELDTAAKHIASALRHCRAVILNADDPLVVKLAQTVAEKRVTYFGGAAQLRSQLPHDAALHSQKQASEPIISKQQQTLHLTAASPTADGQKIKLEYNGKKYSSNVRLLGVYNAYNLAAAVLAALKLGLEFRQVLGELGAIVPAFGRGEEIEVAGRKLKILLVKNPAGFNQIIQTFLNAAPRPVLMAVNDQIADGRDVSWLWDVDFEVLSGYGQRVFASGLRGYDLALRLDYAGIKSEAETDLPQALDNFIAGLQPGESGYIVPTYTAMLELRRLLARRVRIKAIWESDE